MTDYFRTTLLFSTFVGLPTLSYLPLPPDALSHENRDSVSSVFVALPLAPGVCFYWRLPKRSGAQSRYDNDKK